MSLPNIQEKKRPTVALAMIVKNERKNLSRLLDSVKGCFDEIHITDTGSTDGTIEYLESIPFGPLHDESCSVHLHHFKWVNDFAAARNYAFSHVKTDFVMWMDGDDVLWNREQFIQWRNYGMEFADVHLVPYAYAVNPDGSPIISFARERVMKTAINPTWRYRLHEGIELKREWSKQWVPKTSWRINHMRDMEDINADKSRNITILEELKKEGKLDPRLAFYYGKELYEQQRPAQAAIAFEEALLMELEPHDRLLGYQYCAYSYVAQSDQLKVEHKDEINRLLQRALDMCQKGILMDPNRAEYHVCAGDIYLKVGDLVKALPYYGAAKKCLRPEDMGSSYEGAIYSFVDCYGLNPTLQLSKIYYNLARLEDSKAEATEAWNRWQSPDAEQMLQEIGRAEGLTKLDNDQTFTPDIVFTCPPVTAYPFDEEIYKTKPLGGSETALVCMAKNLKEKTGRNVIVFNMRDEDLVAESGVEYRSNKGLNEYFSKNRPAAHIAWRHNIELTKADTYLWCHDLITPSVESRQNFKKIMCLTPFHKNYVMGMQACPEDKIMVTRNGITPEKFEFERPAKNSNKLVWMSSPDRGLDRAMLVMDKVREEFPEAELHVYYGLDNLYKYGLGDLAEKLKLMMSERPWVKYHGFTEQNKMYRDVADAAVWVHPCNFIETFCITAIEMLALGIFPVTRRLGALADTLRDAEMRGQATLLEHDCVTELEVLHYAKAVKAALFAKAWEKIDFDIKKHSWEAVADEWIEEMKIRPIDSEEKAG